VGDPDVPQAGHRRKGQASGEKAVPDGVCQQRGGRVRAPHTSQNQEMDTSMARTSGLGQAGDRCPAAAVALTD
jgi:hypothetical protein